MRHTAPTATFFATLVVCLAVPAASQANLVVSKLNDESPPTELVTFTSAKCRKGTGKKPILKFAATAKKSGYELRVNMYSSPKSYRTIKYGGSGTVDFTFDAPDGTWSNLNVPPDSPPAGGGISFNPSRTRFGLGFSPAFDGAATSGISLGGGVKCIYPKPKKKRRR